MDKAVKCEGACLVHSDIVQLVRVTESRTGKDWGFFWYCENASIKDLNNGLDVEIQAGR